MIDTLPVELIVKIMIDMDYTELIKTKNSSKEFHDIYTANFRTIYEKRIISETCVKDLHDMYLVMSGKAEMDEICLANQQYSKAEHVDLNYILNYDEQFSQSTNLLNYINYLDYCLTLNASSLLVESIEYRLDDMHDIMKTFIDEGLTNKIVKKGWDLVSHKYKTIIEKLTNLSNDGVVFDKNFIVIKNKEYTNPDSILGNFLATPSNKYLLEYFESIEELSHLLSFNRLVHHIVVPYFFYEVDIHINNYLTTNDELKKEMTDLHNWMKEMDFRDNQK